MTTNLNIRMDKEIKDQADKIFAELGLNMTTAINLFLRTAIRERGIPFQLKLEIPNEETKKSFIEGDKMINDTNTRAYTSIEDLKNSLNI